MVKPHKYTEEQRQFILDNYKGISNIELAKMFNEKFNTNFSKERIASYKGRFKLDSGLLGGYYPGVHKFRKGKATNCKPIGYESTRGKEFLWRKTAYPDVWKLVHHIVWENIYGKIPKGYKIMHLDGDKKNNVIENLALVSDAELLMLNIKDLKSKDKELTKSGLAVAKVMIKVNKIKKSLKENK